MNYPGGLVWKIQDLPRHKEFVRVKSGSGNAAPEPASSIPVRVFGRDCVATQGVAGEFFEAVRADNVGRGYTVPVANERIRKTFRRLKRQ